MTILSMHLAERGNSFFRMMEAMCMTTETETIKCGR